LSRELECELDFPAATERNRSGESFEENGASIPAAAVVSQLDIIASTGAAAPAAEAENCDDVDGEIRDSAIPSTNTQGGVKHLENNIE